MLFGKKTSKNICGTGYNLCFEPIVSGGDNCGAVHDDDPPPAVLAAQHRGHGGVVPGLHVRHGGHVAHSEQLRVLQPAPGRSDWPAAVVRGRTHPAQL